MRFDRQIERCAFVIDRSLRKAFPDDYNARCMYAAYGMHTLAKGMGLSSHLVAGDFVGLCVSHDGREMKHEAWWTKSNGEPGHFWCVIEEHIVDLGLMYLQDRAPFVATDAPVVVWPTTEKFPAYLMYDAHENFHPDVQLQLPEHMMANFSSFLPICEKKMRALKGRPKMKSWLLEGRASLDRQASNGDVWARGAKLVDNQSSSLRRVG